MSLDDHSGDRGQPRGFAGLASNVSDIDADIARAGVVVEKTTAAAQASECAERPFSFAGSGYGRQDEDSGSSKSLIIILIIGAVLFGIFWLASQTPGVSPPATLPADTSAPTSAWEAPAAPPEPETIPEEMPPTGTGLQLGVNQIRYCLAEDIRIDAADPVVDASNWSQIERFNSMVSDYNSRCANFRYLDGPMNEARGDVEAHRVELEAEGRNRFLVAPGSGGNPVNEQPSSVEPVDNGEASAPASEFERAREGEVETPGPASSEPQGAPSLSGLTDGERKSLTMACAATVSQGPAVHNQCLQNQVAQLAYSTREPNMSRLTYDERQSLERVCMTAKFRGPASYNQCLLAKMPMR